MNNNSIKPTTLFQMTSLVTLAIVALVLAIGVKPKPVESRYYSNAPSTAIYDYKEITIVKADFGFVNTSDLDINITKGSGGEEFTYTGRAKQFATTTTYPWYELKSASTQWFKQEVAAGSPTNKWYLTSISVDFATAANSATNEGKTNVVKLNDVELFSFVTTKSVTANTTLNEQRTTATMNFNMGDGITTFALSPTFNLKVAEIKLGYTIDYTNC